MGALSSSLREEGTPIDVGTSRERPLSSSSLGHGRRVVTVEDLQANDHVMLRTGLRAAELEPPVLDLALFLQRVHECWGEQHQLQLAGAVTRRQGSVRP